MRVLAILAAAVLFTACEAQNPSSFNPTSPDRAIPATPGRVTVQPSTLNSADNGFDELGYNRTAGIFQGPADGVDGTLDGTAYGNPAYGKDLLKMKWNSEWDRGNAEGWDDPNGYRAWIDNNWNGQVPGGSGEVWQYRIVWIGSCGSDGTPTGDGGYCLWGQFEVVLSHGTAANQHFWDAHAVPAGFGPER